MKQHHKRGNFSRKYKAVERRTASAPKENVGVGGLNKNNWRIVNVDFNGTGEKIDVDDFKMFVNEKLKEMMIDSSKKKEDIDFNSFILSNDDSATIEFKKEGKVVLKMLKLDGTQYKDYTLTVRRPYDFSNRDKKDHNNYRSESRDYNSRIRNRDRDPDNNYRSESRDYNKKRYKVKGIEDEYGSPKRKHRQHRQDGRKPNISRDRDRDRDRDSLSKKKNLLKKREKIFILKNS